MEVTKISVILAVFLGTSMMIYGRFFIERWMGINYLDSYNVLVILCIPMIIALSQNPSIGLLYGISKHNYFALFNCCEGVLNLILSLILVRYYGIYGVALGTAIPMILIKLFVQPIYVCRLINVSLIEYYLDTLFLSTIKTITPLLIYWYIVRDYLMPNYLIIFPIAFFQVIVFVPICFFFILTPMQRQFMIKGMRHIKRTVTI